jgi:hypothetical protein
MAIAFVGAATNNGASVTLLTCTYAATSGNIVTLFLNHAQPVTALTVKDNGGNLLTAGPTVSFATLTNVASGWYYTAGAGVSNFVATWTTARAVGMNVTEYSGVTGGVNGALAGNTATGTSVAPTITVTTQDDNDWVSAGLFARSITITVSAGNSRVANNVQSTAKLESADNTSVAIGSVTIAGTCGSQAWACIALELRLTAVVAAAANHNQLMMVGCGT